MRPELYTLVGHEPKPCTLDEYVAQFGDRKKRIIKQDKLDDGTMVSTVFLGLDHNYHPDGPPLLFETMVFKGSWEENDLRRYSTWEEAVAGHEEMLAKVKGSR